MSGEIVRFRSSEGLITRIGRWIDERWESKVGRKEFEEFKLQGFATIEDFKKLRERMDFLEVYSGMKRAPTVPGQKPVEKSAFSM